MCLWRLNGIEGEAQVFMIIVVTGTPGTGKSTLAESLAKIAGARLIGANDIIREGRLYSGIEPDGTLVAKMSMLAAELRRLARRQGNAVLDGHLLCEIRISGAVCIVVREHLGILEKRLAKRGYSKNKIWENLVAEAVDYCGERSKSNYTHVFEVFSGIEAKKVLDIIKNKRRMEEIELLDELLPFVKRYYKRMVR